MAKRKSRKKQLSGGKLLFGLMTGGMSLLVTGVHKDTPRKNRKKGMSYRDDRWADRASWF